MKSLNLVETPTITESPFSSKVLRRSERVQPIKLDFSLINYLRNLDFDEVAIAEIKTALEQLPRKHKLTFNCISKLFYARFPMTQKEQYYKYEYYKINQQMVDEVFNKLIGTDDYTPTAPDIRYIGCIEGDEFRSFLWMLEELADIQI